MFTVVQSEPFDKWFDGLRDLRARTRVTQRLERMAGGQFGDIKALGGGLAELRIDYGPGYRIYFSRRGRYILVLLCGGDKSTQRRDIAEARRVLEIWIRDHGDEMEGV